jgi:sugar O-acyltransferase (sialic acid O-acetyltransferase NeuD family)
MEINSLNVLGISEPTITMLLDNLESNNVFPELYILNNLKKVDLLPYENPLFKIYIKSNIDEINSHNQFFLGVNKPTNKIAVFNEMSIAIERYTSVAHKSVAISSTTKIGKGVHINSLVSIAAFSIIDDFVSINRNCSIGHHSSIGKFTTVNPGANIAGFVKIGHGCLIGMGVNIIDGIEIGSNTIIGAGSVVTKNIPDNVVAYGNPCKIIRSNET